MDLLGPSELASLLVRLRLVLNDIRAKVLSAEDLIREAVRLEAQRKAVARLKNPLGEVEDQLGDQLDEAAQEAEDQFKSALTNLTQTFGSVRGKIRIVDALAAAGFEQPGSYRMTLFGRVMRQLGWERRRLRFGRGVREYAYVRGGMLGPILDVVRTDSGLVVRPRES